MSDANWGDEPLAPPKKSIPTWLWFCGGGCLLAILVGVGFLWLGVNAVKKAVDPELIAQQLDEMLPHDELPHEMQPIFAMSVGIKQVTIQDSRGYQIQFQQHTGKNAKQMRSQMFQTDEPEFPDSVGVAEFKDLQTATVDVQGTDVPVIRLRMQLSGILGAMMPEEAKNQMGAMMFADLTPGDEEKVVMAQIMRMPSDGQLMDKDQAMAPITDDELRELMQPFHVGPNR